MIDPKAKSSSLLTITSLDSNCNRFSSYWEKLDGINVPKPTTKLLPINVANDGAVSWNTNQIISIMDDWDSNRAFIRSDYKAAPEYLAAGSFITEREKDEIDRTISSLLNQLSTSAWSHGKKLVLREWLDLNFCTKQSHINCHPEVRFFIEAGEVLAGVPIQIGEEDVCSLQYESLTDVLENATSDVPRSYAQTVAGSFNEKTWAIDFVMDTNGDWYCTEMGLNAVRWDEEDGRWINHCDHSSLEPFGPGEIHSAALQKAKKSIDDLRPDG